MTSGKKSDVFLLREMWQSKNGPTPFLDGYSYMYKTRTPKLGGGVGIFVLNKLRYKPRLDLELNCETLEHCIIEVKLKKHNLLICSGYRAPGHNLTKFVEEYEKLLSHLNNMDTPILIGLDHNLDLLKHKNHNPTRLFIEKTLDSNMVPCITKLTRVTKSSATLIDNIFVPLNLVLNVSSYIIIEDMSDHLPIVMILSDVEIGGKSKHVAENQDL